MSTTTVKAPARVCLFGDHQDYLGLPVIACAIDRYITFHATENNTAQLNFDFSDLGKKRSLDLNEDLNDFEPQDYIKSGLKVLAGKGIQLKEGYNIEVSGDIPINAGLSSSSAFVVGWLTLVLKLTDNLDRFSSAEIGHMAYQAEVEEHGQAGGKMDQYTSAIGGTIYIDTSKDMSYETLESPIKNIIIASSGVPKTTLAGLKDLNINAHAAIDQIKTHIPEFDIAKVNLANYKDYEDYVTDELQRFYQAAFRNHQITQRAKEAFDQGIWQAQDYAPLLYLHHNILKTQLHITTPEIDKLIDTAFDLGRMGKIVGSGGGGCIACIPTKDNKEEIIHALQKAGAVEVFEARVSKGAKDLAL